MMQTKVAPKKSRLAMSLCLVIEDFNTNSGLR
jgi:hypothetical protein